MTPGTFSGGTDAQVQDDHLEVSADGQGGWSWFKQALTHELTADDDGKYFRAFSLVTEEGLDSVSGASAAVGPVTTPISYDPLVVGDPVVTGSPIIGYTLTCSEPSISGGSGDVQITYYWQDANNQRVLYMSGNTQLVEEVDIARSLCCQVVVIDQVTGDQATVVSNSVGPINRPTLGDYQTYVDNVLNEEGSLVGVTPSQICGCLVQEDDPVLFPPKDTTFNWQIRTGTGRLSGDNGTPFIGYVAPDTAPAGALVTCTISSSDAQDATDLAIEFLVAE